MPAYAGMFRFKHVRIQIILLSFRPELHLPFERAYGSNNEEINRRESRA